MNYDVDYFIKKFEATKEQEWCTDAFQDEFGRKCAMGFCRAIILSTNPECEALRKILKHKTILGIDPPVCINDNRHSKYSQLGITPRERILNALYKVKAGKPILLM